MIKLKCCNDICGYCYEVTEAELLENSSYHKSCMICGSRMIVENVEEIIAQEIEKQAEENLHQYLNEYGIEGTIELIERSPKNGARDLYMRKLRERGLVK